MHFTFSCDIWQVDSYGWNINGTFNGVMGLFQQKKIQMLSHATIMREDRLAAVEFTAEVFVIEYILHRIFTFSHRIVRSVFFFSKEKFYHISERQ